MKMDVEIKTTDGHVIDRSRYYYSVDGQRVLVHDCIVLNSGEHKYLVTYCYNADGMDVKCYGDGFVEHSYSMEIEGDETIINKVFKNAPTPIMSAEYKEGVEKASNLKIEVEELSKIRDELISIVSELEDKNEKLIHDVSVLFNAKAVIESNSNQDSEQ